MKGHVSTPDDLTEYIVQGLFEIDPPSSKDRILYPGTGTAPFAAAVERICESEDWEIPKGLGIELDPKHLTEARQRDLNHVSFEERDFLDEHVLNINKFDYIVGNPPYVPIDKLSESEKSRYRDQFDTATGRFDLYLLFFEQALNLLAQEGRLAFVTPEKFEYVKSAAPLRRLLTNGEYHIESIEHIDDTTFDSHNTFPCITQICHQPSDSNETTQVTLRDNTTHTASFPLNGESWAASVRGKAATDWETGVTLEDITTRISPGVATGADAIFVNDRDELPQELVSNWTYPTVSGSQLSTNNGPRTDSVLVSPYREDGTLATEDELDEFGEWIKEYRDDLQERSCVQKGHRKWYGWHVKPPMSAILQPKIVFRDISKELQFWAEPEGDIIPRNSVYFLVPKDDVTFGELLEYLNSSEARAWMRANCQKAANGFFRLQTRVLEKLPVPRELVDDVQATI